MLWEAGPIENLRNIQIQLRVKPLGKRGIFKYLQIWAFIDMGVLSGSSSRKSKKKVWREFHNNDQNNLSSKFARRNVS